MALRSSPQLASGQRTSAVSCVQLTLFHLSVVILTCTLNGMLSAPVNLTWASVMPSESLTGRLFQMNIWCGVLNSCCSASWPIFTTCPTTGRATPTRARPAMRWHSFSNIKRWELREIVTSLLLDIMSYFVHSFINIHYRSNLGLVRFFYFFIFYSATTH